MRTYKNYLGSGNRSSSHEQLDRPIATSEHR